MGRAHNAQIVAQLKYTWNPHFNARWAATDNNMAITLHEVSRCFNEMNKFSAVKELLEKV